MVFYDQTGSPIAYVEDTDIYLYDGTPAAYISDGEYIYSYNGSFLGWFSNGCVYDLKGRYVFFTENSQSGPMKPMKKMTPMKSLKSMRPMKSMKQMKPMRPMTVSSWSELSGIRFFA